MAAAVEELLNRRVVESDSIFEERSAAALIAQRAAIPFQRVDRFQKPRQRRVVVAAHLAHHAFDKVSARFYNLGKAAKLLCGTFRSLLELNQQRRNRPRLRDESRVHENVAWLFRMEYAELLQRLVHRLLGFDKIPARLDRADKI